MGCSISKEAVPFSPAGKPVSSPQHKEQQDSQEAGARDIMDNSSQESDHVTTQDAVEREKMINIHSRVKPQRGQNIFSEPLKMDEEFIVPLQKKRGGNSVH